MYFEKMNLSKTMNTIGFRLTLWGAGITISICFLLCMVLYVGLWFSLRHEVDGVLEGEVQELTASVFKKHGHDYQAAERDISLELSHRVRNDLCFRMFDNNGQLLVNCDPDNRLGGVNIPTSGMGSDSSKSSFKTVEIPGDRNSMRVHSLSLKDEDGHTYLAQTGYRLDQVTKSLATFRLICLGSLLVLAIAAIGGGRIIAIRSLRPMQVMTTKAKQISARELNERLPLRGTGDELDVLAETLNEMLNRIQQYVTGLRQFTADVSHEFRSPLAALRGNAEVALTRHRSEAELRHVIEESIEQYDRLARIAEDLLFLARADADHLPLYREKMRLNQAIADVVNLYAPLAQDRDIQLIFTESKETWLQADGSRLRQLIGNLVDNAIKYIGSGKRIEVSLESTNSTAYITVKDDGPGISHEHCVHLFDRFYRVDQSRSPQGSMGAGLGLSICRTIAEAHGGKIDIASTPGKGTSVTVTIPLYAGDKPM